MAAFKARTRAATACLAIVALALLVFAASANALTPFAYVTGNSWVGEINTSTNTVAGEAPAGSAAAGVAITPDGAFAYVTNQGDNTVSVISTSTNTIVANVPVGSFPLDVAITPNGAFAYVTNQGDNAVSVIGTSTNTVVATVAGIVEPLAVAITPDNAFAYVTEEGKQGASLSNVTVINTTSHVVDATIPLAVNTFPLGIAITPDGKFAYATNSKANDVSVINTKSRSVVATVTVGKFPYGVAITPDGAFAQFFKAPARNLFLLPENVPFDVGALMADAVITSVHAVYDRSNVKSAATAAVIGAGGVGQIIIQLLKDLGLRVIAVSRSESKLAVAKSIGADEAWRAGEPNIGARSREIASDGIDVVFDCVGSDESMKEALVMVKRCGRIVMVGEEDASFPADSTEIAQRELEIIGSRNGSRSNMQMGLQLLSLGVIKPVISDVFELEDVNKALDRVRQGASGRVILKVG